DFLLLAQNEARRVFLGLAPESAFKARVRVTPFGCREPAGPWEASRAGCHQRFEIHLDPPQTPSASCWRTPHSLFPESISAVKRRAQTIRAAAMLRPFCVSARMLTSPAP